MVTGVQKWPAHTLGDSSLASTVREEKKAQTVLSIGGGSPARDSLFTLTLCSHPSAPRPSPWALLMRLHPEGPSGTVSIRTSPPRPRAPASPHQRLSRGSRPRSLAPAHRFRTEPALSSPGRQFRLSRWPRSRDAPSQAPSARTHPISHGPVTVRSLTTGFVKKQTAQLVLTESNSVRRRLLLLLPAILPVSESSAGSWQRPPPPRLHLSGRALPVVASRAVETVGPPENYNPRGALHAWVSVLVQ